MALKNLPEFSWHLGAGSNGEDMVEGSTYELFPQGDHLKLLKGHALLVTRPLHLNKDVKQTWLNIDDVQEQDDPMSR